MKVNKLSFPHPVLGLGDDVAGVYSIEFKNESVELDRDLIKLNIKHVLANKTLEKLVSDGFAQYCIEVQCPQTVFKESYFSQNSEHLIKIPANYLRNKTYLSAYIVAATNIDEYKPAGLNPDYEDSIFNIEKGDVLAYFDGGWFLAGKTWEAMRSASSIISIKEDKDEKEKINFVLTNDKILIKLPTESHRRYAGLYRKPELRDIILACIALPAVMYALSVMMADKDEENNYSDSVWYEIFQARRRKDPDLKTIKWEVGNIPQIAQVMLGLPIGGALKNAENIITSSFNITNIDN